ncbi:hypothetical protein [Halomonas halodenitrificans]|uniref:hypothetical protein n=1 Tax=Halomonas halodenitrificans TaxID=28252 RepID=UPI000485A52A|nr:hypothetical protein [Halomonas halodenitrificans]
MTLRPLVVCLLAIWLAGCEMLPRPSFESPSERNSAVTPSNDCYAERPSFVDEGCLLSNWVDFGLASQRGDRAWRNTMLERLEGEAAERRLARAVALSWGNQRQWKQASELFKADLSAAPRSLQPLLRYWLNELERRRAMVGRLSAAQSSRADSEASRAALEEENADLQKKLEALTAIEQSINMRKQIEE